MSGLRNISLRTFRKFLIDKGCKKIRTKGGHEVWSKEDLLRPIIIQTHENPIPEFVILNNLRNMGLTKKDFLEWLKS